MECARKRVPKALDLSQTAVIGTETNERKEVIKMNGTKDFQTDKEEKAKTKKTASLETEEVLIEELPSFELALLQGRDELTSS